MGTALKEGVILDCHPILTLEPLYVLQITNVERRYSGVEGVIYISSDADSWATCVGMAWTKERLSGHLYFR